MNKGSERADARRNRERLIEAALELLAERGLDVDVREICERSGIGVATLYRNFSTKEDLVAAIIDQVNDEIEAALKRVRAESDPEQMLIALLDEMFATADRYHELARVLRQSVHAREAHEQKAEPRARMIRLFTAIFRRAQRAGVVRDDIAPRLLVDILGGSIIIYIELLRTESPAVGRQVVSRTLWSALRGTPQDVPQRSHVRADLAHASDVPYTR